MATNMALKRAKKAQRRQQVVIQKRKAEAIEGSLAGQVFRAAQMPIRACLITRSVFKAGMGSVVLVRGPTPYQGHMGMFLIDTFCLGVKDVAFTSIDEELMEAYLAASEAQGMPMAEVEPSDVRKLLRDLVAWSQSIGIAPHRDFQVVERLFGAVQADASETAFQFGLEGRPLYVPGPGETPPIIAHRLRQLRERLGDDGFDFQVAV